MGAIITAIGVIIALFIIGFGVYFVFTNLSLPIAIFIVLFAIYSIITIIIWRKK